MQRGQLAFKGVIDRDLRACMYTISIMSPHLYACIMYVHIHVLYVLAVDPLPYGKILRAAFTGISWLQHAATFRGWWDFKVRRQVISGQGPIQMNVDIGSKIILNLVNQFHFQVRFSDFITKYAVYMHIDPY